VPDDGESSSVKETVAKENFWFHGWPGSWRAAPLPTYHAAVLRYNHSALISGDLSRGRQPVAVEIFHKNRSFGLVPLNRGASCAVAQAATRSLSTPESAGGGVSVPAGTHTAWAATNPQRRARVMTKFVDLLNRERPCHPFLRLLDCRASDQSLNPHLDSSHG
jgi:hypothetical protein